MSDEASIDAESSTRNKRYGAYEHLLHLLSIGHAGDSALIRGFARENNLEADLKQWILENKEQQAND